MSRGLQDSAPSDPRTRSEPRHLHWNSIENQSSTRPTPPAQANPAPVLGADLSALRQRQTALESDIQSDWARLSTYYLGPGVRESLDRLIEAQVAELDSTNQQIKEAEAKSLLRSAPASAVQATTTAIIQKKRIDDSHAQRRRILDSKILIAQTRLLDPHNSRETSLHLRRDIRTLQEELDLIIMEMRQQ